MKNYTFKVVINYEGDWDGESKDTVEHIFPRMYNMLVDITNPLLKRYNSEWDELHPEISDMEEGSAIWNEYNKFIADKCNSDTKILRSAMYDLFGYAIKHDPEYDAAVVLSNSKGGKAYFTLEK